jgi:ribose 5-phosphate isomerase B
MKIALASDHGGINLKREVIKYLVEKGYEYQDFGTHTADSCDYPDFALPAAEAVARGEFDKGIVICSTGIGVSIVANKVPGIRCAHCHDTYCAEYTRRHNDSNVLAMGEKVVGVGYALQIVEKFLTTEFEGGRHQRRVDKITAIEKKYCK